MNVGADNVFWHSLQNDVAKFTKYETLKETLIFAQKNRFKSGNLRIR